jgi:hypothetical protein
MHWVARKMEIFIFTCVLPDLLWTRVLWSAKSTSAATVAERQALHDDRARAVLAERCMVLFAFFGASRFAFVVEFVVLGCSIRTSLKIAICI